jgi:hypothetical protein
MQLDRIKYGNDEGDYWDKYGPAPITDGEAKVAFAALAAILADIWVGIPMVAMLGHSNDYGEVARREYYGQAGSYRLKDYGFEYRTLSSAIMLSPVLFTWALGALRQHVAYPLGNTNENWGQKAGPFTEKAVAPSYDQILEEVKRLKDKYDFGRVQGIINGHDVNEAKAFVDDHNMLNRALYQAKLYTALTDIVNRDVVFNTNLFEAWALDTDIVNHEYIGCESYDYKGYGPEIIPWKAQRAEWI